MFGCGIWWFDDNSSLHIHLFFIHFVPSADADGSEHEFQFIF